MNKKNQNSKSQSFTMNNTEDCLFLIEALVEKLTFIRAPSFSDKDFKTCISLDFLKLPPLEIIDEGDASISSQESPYIKEFNSGKSCLFVLKRPDIERAMESFIVHVNVYKSLPSGCLPSKIMLGKCTIDLTSKFVEARNKFDAIAENKSFESLKDCFTLTGPDGSESGTLSLFLRVSCFGNNIVTKFQAQQEAEKSNLEANDFPQGSDSNVGAHYGPEALTVNPVCQEDVDPYKRAACLTQKDNPCYCKGAGYPPMEKKGGRNVEGYCLHVPKGRQKQYEELGTLLTGNELKIKVPTEFAPVKKISETRCTFERAYTKAGTIGSGPCDNPCAWNQICLQMPRAPECCNKERPQQMQFRCTTEGCQEVYRHKQELAQVPLTVPTPAEARQVLHPNKDVFVFKVFKNSVAGDRKTKLELELVAPKGPEKKIPTRIDTRETQFSCPPPCSPCCPVACCTAPCSGKRRRKKH